MSNTDDIEAQIREMANLTVLSNKINPIQEKNLKMFPMVYFNGVSSVSITYDLFVDQGPNQTNADPGHFVKYNIVIDEKADNSKLDLRFQHLERSVKNLFWQGVQTIVVFNGRQVFESKK